MTTLAVIGATGQADRVIHALLEERNADVDGVHFFASVQSAGKVLPFRDKDVVVEDVATADLPGIDVVVSSVGGGASLKYAPKFAAVGAVVVDNSPAWRKDPDMPLVVSEVNPHTIRDRPKGIVANPNCTTIIATPVLRPLHDRYGLIHLMVSSYRAVSGSGLTGVRGLEEQTRSAIKQDITKLAVDGSMVDLPEPSAYVAPVTFSVVALADKIVGDRPEKTDREQKPRNESCRILGAPDLAVSGIRMRVPVFSGHGLTVSAEFTNPVAPDEVRAILTDAPGVELDDVPTPLRAAGTDPCYVGRIHTDRSVPDGRGLAMFVVGDDLCKGAALNTIQLAEIVLAELKSS